MHSIGVCFREAVAVMIKVEGSSRKSTIAENDSEMIVVVKCKVMTILVVLIFKVNLLNTLSS